VRVAWSAGEVKYPAVLDPVWSTTGSLATARREPTTTVLQDGRVLAVGGLGDAWTMTPSAEVYDPATGTWATTGSLTTARQFHSSTLLGSGQVLVAGGEQGSAYYGGLSTAELYDPATGTWSSAASLNSGRLHHQTVLLQDGRVLVMGGLDASSGAQAGAELYDPVANTWTPTGPLAAPRYMHAAVRLSGGKVLVFGGAGYTDSAITSELYDPATGTWAPGGGMNSWHNTPLGVLLSDGRVLAISANNYTPGSELYDPATGTWSVSGPPSLVRHDATASLLPDGRVLLAGGMSGTSGPQPTAAADVYDPDTGTWSLGATLQTGRSMHAASVLQDGRVLVVAGMGLEDYTTLASAEVLLLDRDDVTAPSVTLTSPVEGASVEGQVLVEVSASDDYGVKRVEVYDGDTLIGTVTNAPYSITWYSQGGSAPNGPHVLTARAYDVAENMGTSAPVSVILNNDVTPPSVTLTSPAPGSNPQGVLTLSAEASDDRGTVTRVEFWDGRKQLGVDTEAPYSMNWDLASVPGGPHTVIAKAFDAVLNMGTASASITVSQPGTASHDSSFQAPRCTEPGSLCDSGSYLVGRGSQDPGEFHPPNTLQGTCADGTAHTYYGASIDRIRLSTSDGSAFEVGKRVNVQVTVWASLGYSMEQLDLYYTADATQPVWTYLATLSPGASGARTMSTSYVLPAGAMQAVRGRFRSGGFAAPCGTGEYDDHDDLVFPVSADVTAPTVSLTAPAAGATVSGTTTLSASASDNTEVSRVEFYDGTTLLGTDTTAPYSSTWNTVGRSNGFHTLQARAYDTAGNVGQSASVTVLVANDVTAPTVSLTAPVAGALVRGTLSVSASASDNVGVTRVEFYVGTTLLNTDTAAPYAFAWNTTSLPNGSHTLQARASDAAGNVGTSASVTVTVSNDKTAPTVSITAPAAGATVIGTTTVSASASDTEGVTRVDFYDGTALLGTDTTTPFSYTWNTTGAAAGSHTLQARAYDPTGNVGTSASVTVTVVKDTTAPTVSLTAPAAGAIVSGTTTLSASASDNVGVTRVDFYDGATLLGSDMTTPFSYAWNTANAAAGSHTLRARAHDAAGNVGTSVTVQVTVDNNPQPPAPGMAAYDATLGAPRCSSAGSSCDSGPLLNGRAQLGPEGNAPNTVDTCTDGISGGYHSDESLDRLKVSSEDGLPLAAGKSLRIEATVWAYSGYSADSLDLYYAPDSSAPSWTYLGTLKPTAAGAQVLSTTYTPASGSARAVVRGVFRFNGTASPCEGGSYTDVDDLVFSAQ
jgi:hypothetical protein